MYYHFCSQLRAHYKGLERMSIKKLVILLTSSLMLGLFFIALRQNYIILNFWNSGATQISSASHKKKVIISFWHNDQWKQEEVQLLIDSHVYNNTYHMMSQYLQLLFDESIIKHKVNVQQVLMNYDSQEIFVSFDRTIWSKDSCTVEKIMIVEGILKTLKKNEPSIKKVKFLMNHQPMTDAHLDFTNAWPIDGFLKS